MEPPSGLFPRGSCRLNLIEAVGCLPEVPAAHSLRTNPFITMARGPSSDTHLNQIVEGRRLPTNPRFYKTDTISPVAHDAFEIELVDIYGFL